MRTNFSQALTTTTPTAPGYKRHQGQRLMLNVVVLVVIGVLGVVGVVCR